jgi:hypothetical protein
MRLFWMAWGLALLLLAGVVGGGSWLIAVAADAALAYRLGSWAAALLLLAFGFVGAFRLAFLGTLALKHVLARNLAIVIALELEELQALAHQQAALLSAASGAGRVVQFVPSGLRIPRFFGERSELRELLGPATGQTLEYLLESLQHFNAAAGDPVALRHELDLVLYRLESALRALAPFSRASMP